MSASCEMVIKVDGNDEEFKAIVQKLIDIEGKPSFQFPNNTYYPFSVDVINHEIVAYNGGCRNIWGTYYLQPEADLYIDLAKAAPNASFEVDSSRIYEGGGGGCETYLKVSYRNRKLEFKLQACVDSMSLAELCANMSSIDLDTDFKVAIVGRSKFFVSKEELEEYLSEYNIDVVHTNEIDETVTHIICNNLNSTAKAIQKAKNLNIPVITEAQAIRMFGDVYDFEDDEEKLIQDLTYEEFCQMYKVDDTVTKEAFEREKDLEIACDFILYDENHVSFEGIWQTEVYLLKEDGEFEGVSKNN